MNKSILNIPFIIFIISLIAIFANTVSSIYFISIMMIGIIFLSLRQSIKNKQYYTLGFLILTMLYLEVNMGFKPFSLTLFAFFSHIFIMPYMQRVMSFSTISNYVYVAWFYIGSVFVYSLNNDLSLNLFSTTIFNILIDFIIIGLFI